MFSKFFDINFDPFKISTLIFLFFTRFSLRVVEAAALAVTLLVSRKHPTFLVYEVPNGSNSILIIWNCRNLPCICSITAAITRQCEQTAKYLKDLTVIKNI